MSAVAVDMFPVEGMTHKPVAQTLPEAWRDFLGTFHWEWFCNLTFRDAVHPEAASKRFRLWVSELNRSLYGKNWHKRPRALGGVHWCCALEWQKRGVLHFHALVGGKRATEYRGDDLFRSDRFVWMDRWEQLAGFSRLYLVDDQDSAVRRYVSKYVAKGGAVDCSANCGVRGRVLARGSAAS